MSGKVSHAARANQPRQANTGMISSGMGAQSATVPPPPSEPKIVQIDSRLGIILGLTRDLAVRQQNFVDRMFGAAPTNGADVTKEESPYGLVQCVELKLDFLHQTLLHLHDRMNDVERIG
jgi:hypothetical protein